MRGAVLARKQRTKGVPDATRQPRPQPGGNNLPPPDDNIPF
jgi:hypothetical protein